MPCCQLKRIYLVPIYLGLFILFIIHFGCSHKDNKKRQYRSLEEIKKQGKIRVITRNNANCYYNYRGQAMGFEYDLAKAFADYLDLELEVLTPSWNKMFGLLNQGQGDFLAASVTVTNSREKVVDFSDEYMAVQQQIIKRKSQTNINSLTDLNGTKIHVRNNTSYKHRLKELQNGGLKFEIISHNNIPTEELIREVSENIIDLTVADSNIALLNRRYYPNIVIAFPISEKQSLGWAVAKGNQQLLAKINQFLDKAEENGTYGKIYERYYANVEIFDYVDLVKYHNRIHTRLPKYKEIIKKEAQKFGYDWRLIAAMIYQESHFNPKAKSFTGVKGLMQVTQNTAKEMGIDNRLDPAQSVHAGVKYFSKQFNRLDEIKDRWNRILIALASYNVGYGHVKDAQKLARQKGLNPNKWASLKRTLPLLRIPQYYKQTKYGYARGTEPVRYVERILTYYDILKRREISVQLDKYTDFYLKLES